MEEKTFQIEQLNNVNDWYVLTLDEHGQLIRSQIVGPNKKEAIKALKSAQDTYSSALYGHSQALKIEEIL